MRLGAADIKRVFDRYHGRLMDYREAINGLNVYPVPDGDTGTNMALTVDAVVRAIEGAGSMTDLANGLAHGSLMGARGNSGVILSQILRGLADCFREVETVGTDELVAALDRASIAAYAAVQKPVEGTILTVLREAAEAASVGHTELADDLPALLDHVYRRGEDALERTPQMLPVLAQAGVVDAGGAGFLLLLSSFVEVAGGGEVDLPEGVLRAHADLDAIVAEPSTVSLLRYEVMYFLETPESQVDEFRRRWSELGDSIVVVGGGDTWNCHIHTDHIGAAIEAGIAVGTPRDIRVTDLSEQSGSAIHDHRRHGFVPTAAAQVAPVGVVAVVAGAGLVGVFAELGVQGVVTGGQSMNPSTEDLLSVVDSVAAPWVVVLPNNKNIVPVAEQLDALSPKRVWVVPTRSVQQGIAAMLGYSPIENDPMVIAEDMAAAASSIVTGEVTQAVRDATVDSLHITKGDWMGIADGTVVTTGPDLERTLRELVAAILPLDSELLTVYHGEGASTSTLKALEAWIGELHPEMRVEIVEGGQPLYPYLVSIE